MPQSTKQSPPKPPPTGGGVSIKAIEGIGNMYAAKIRKAGVRTTATLLQKGSTPKDRRSLAKATGITSKLILEWVNRADLFRVKGIGTQYSDLLEAAGVDTVVDLSKRKPEALFTSLARANAQKNLVNQLPGLSQVEAWVKHAKSLKRVVKY